MSIFVDAIGSLFNLYSQTLIFSIVKILCQIKSCVVIHYYQINYYYSQRKLFFFRSKQNRFRRKFKMYPILFFVWEQNLKTYFFERFFLIAYTH